MRAALGIAVVLANSVIVRGQTLQEQAISAQEAETAFQAYIKAASVPASNRSAAIIKATTTPN